MAMVVFVLLLSTCITPFTPKGIDSEGGTVVIEGDIILGSDTKVYVSLSKALNSDKAIVYLRNAQVWVESKSGERYMGVLIASGNITPYYLMNTRALRFDQPYKLCVNLPDGRRYESDLITPLRTPEIDDIEFEVNSSRTAVDFMVTANGESALYDYTPYYKWRFTEDWEFTSHYQTNYYYSAATGFILKYATDPRIYYCWNRAESTSILVAKTDHLEKNVVNRQKVTTIPNSSDKISYLYSMELSQMSISKEAYIYWSTLKKNTDEIGGIFSPQPSEMFGNIRCVSDANIKVYGYISAGTVTTKRIFVYKEELGIYVPSPCPFFDDTGIDPPLTFRQLYDAGYVVVRYLDNDPLEWAHNKCVDCRLSGNKNKPFFWPNNDL